MNFDFLKPIAQLGKLASFCAEAEALVAISPTSSVISSRKALEYVVQLIYRTRIDDSEHLTLFEMMDDARFVDFLDDEVVLDAMHAVRKMGNAAAHDSNMSVSDAERVLEQLHFIVGEVCIMLQVIDDYPSFVRLRDAKKAASAPAPVRVPQAATVPKPEPAKPAAQPSRERVVVEPEVIAEFGPRMRQARFSVAHGRDEEENKRLFLAASLRESGWAIVNTPNQAMPSCAGINCMIEDGKEIDYVLYGRDNRPLAIVDYSTMMKDGPIAARMRVQDAAAKMAVKLGYKPIAYYTNGYRIFCIDQLGFPARRVFDFHTIEELELLKQRAVSRADISAPVIRDEVTNRDYQKEAIRSVCQAFSDMRRRSLLVMATGTGKTRVAISLAEVLMKANWVKNILFLADRTSLVKQAHKSFNKLLPEMPTSVYVGASDERDPNARIIFSTYQTMVNLINDDSKEFTVGRFDLIIIDEAHRSIFKKYGSIFNYFDALMVGLTATPRCEENKSTYKVFDLPAGEPDYAYELEEAIADGYLVGFQVLDRTTDLIRRGISYDMLSEDEKKQFEDAFDDGESIDEPDYSGAELVDAVIDPRRVINIGTIDAMLGDLMQNGLKIDAGDTLGKTFIFANSHKEAEVIVERFQKIYSHLGLDFCKLIDSKVEESQSLIDSFGERGAMPQVAVSVDMLDTGIDVPDALNLVFFKTVQSKIKFLQMVGRGTRLSEDLFGPGLDKQGFLVFDYYDNFRYFSTTGTWSMVENGMGKQGWKVTPQSVLTNGYKLSILRQLDQGAALTAFDKSYREDLRAYFLSEVRSLCNDDVQVQYNLAYVNKYRDEENWNNIDTEKQIEIKEYILPLIPAADDPVKVRNFDALMYVVESEYMVREANGMDPRKIRHGFYNVCTEFTDRMEALLKLKTIPDVMAKEKLIISMIDCDYLMDEFSLERAESVRKELRGLMQYIPNDVRYYVVDFADKIVDGDMVSAASIAAQKPYSAKALDYLEKSKNPSLMKLRNLDPLEDSEKTELEDVFMSELGTAADYAAWSNNSPLLPYLRRQVGIADEAVETKFGSFMNEGVLNETQLELMRQIVAYARENGDVTFGDLLKVSPFCDVDFAGTFGPSISYVQQLVNGLHRAVL